jgi:hypothetical protein
MFGLQLPTKRTNRNNVLLLTTTKSLAITITQPKPISQPITHTTTSKPSIPIAKPKPTAECTATASTAFAKSITN